MPNPELADVAAELLARRSARSHLLPFVGYTHPSWQSGAHHARICEELEAVERGDVRRLAIFAPPRHSKSELASRRFPAWYMGRHPGRQIITASYNAEIATDVGRDVRNLIASEDYRRLFPAVALAADSSAAGRWHTSAGGIYIAAGVGGTITGRGAHVAIIDDPIKNREEADSRTVRDAIWKWYTSTFYTRLMPGGAIVLMLTRWHEDDLAARALQSESWRVVELPAIVGDGENEAALWPDWYPLETLRHTRSVIPDRDWQALYQQRPTSDAGNYIKREWIKRYVTAPAKLNIYLASDYAVAAAREGADPDYTEHGVFGVDSDDNVHVLDWWHGQTAPDVWIEALLDLINKWRPTVVFGEGGVIRRAVEPFLTKRMRERRVYARMEWLVSMSDKEARGRAFQARASMGKVLWPQSSTWADRVIEQCLAFPGVKHDDGFDAMSLLFQGLASIHGAASSKAVPVRKRDRYAVDKIGEVDWRTV